MSDDTMPAEIPATAPPHDPRAESAILALALEHPHLLTELPIEAADFYRPEHEWLWASLIRFQSTGEPITATTVNTRLLEDPREYQRHGGAPFLFDLVQLAHTEQLTAAQFLADVVRNHARRRKILQLGQRLTQLGTTGDPAEAIAHAVDVVDELARDELFGPADEQSSGLAPLTRLDAFLDVPDEDVTYRIEHLWPSGGRVILAAQHKAGKTTTVGNLIRALADGTPFLDTYPVQQVKRVVLIDNELDERMLRRWLRDHGVQDQHRVEVLTLRGRLSTFNILDPATRTTWARHIGPADIVLFDCLRPALDALGLSEDKDAGRFLEALDELTTEAGIPESLTVHHMGHTNERSRGDSRILDWPDALWKLVKDAENDNTAPGSVARYFSAYGRDVDVPQSLIGFDAITRHLHIAGGSRTDRKIDAALDDVIGILINYEAPLSGRQIEERLKDSDHPRNAIRAALQRGTTAGLITTTRGERNAKLHTVTTRSAPNRGSAPSVRQRGESECASAPIGAHGAHTLPLPTAPTAHSHTPEAETA